MRLKENDKFIFKFKNNANKKTHQNKNNVK